MDDDSDVRVLHTLRVAGVVGTSSLSQRLRVPAEELVTLLRTLEARDLVRSHEGALPGWGLTPAGRRRGEELLADELDQGGVRAEVERAYLSFLELNGGVLRACTDWQVRAGTDPMVLNDHSDAQYDAAVLERLEGLHGRAVGLLGRLAAELGRYGGYAPRLSNALERARSGELDWVTKPVIDSYHTVWFEVHEDLLATLGRTRAAERTNARGLR